jgi:hypothetical protein
MLQRRGELLASVKSTCDSELTQFVENFRQQLEKQIANKAQYQEIFNEITHFATIMTEMTAEDIIAGKCTQLVDQVYHMMAINFDTCQGPKTPTNVIH